MADIAAKIAPLHQEALDKIAEYNYLSFINPPQAGQQGLLDIRSLQPKDVKTIRTLIRPDKISETEVIFNNGARARVDTTAPGYNDAAALWRSLKNAYINASRSQTINGKSTAQIYNDLLKQYQAVAGGLTGTTQIKGPPPQTFSEISNPNNNPVIELMNLFGKGVIDPSSDVNLTVLQRMAKDGLVPYVNTSYWDQAQKQWNQYLSDHPGLNVSYSNFANQYVDYINKIPEGTAGTTSYRLKQNALANPYYLKNMASTTPSATEKSSAVQSTTATSVPSQVATNPSVSSASSNEPSTYKISSNPSDTKGVVGATVPVGSVNEAASPTAPTEYGGVQDPTKFPEVASAENDILNTTKQIAEAQRQYLEKIKENALGSLEAIKNIDLQKYDDLKGVYNELITINRNAQDEMKKNLERSKTLYDAILGRDKSAQAAGILNTLKSRGVDISNPAIAKNFTAKVNKDYLDKVQQLEAQYATDLNGVIEKFTGIETSLKEQQGIKESERQDALRTIEEAKKTAIENFFANVSKTDTAVLEKKAEFQTSAREEVLAQVKAEIDKWRNSYENLPEQGKVEAVFNVISKMYEGQKEGSFGPEQVNKMNQIIAEEVARGGTYADTLKRVSARMANEPAPKVQGYIDTTAQDLFDMIKSGKVTPTADNPDWTKYNLSAREEAYKMWTDYQSSGGKSPSSGSTGSTGSTAGATSNTTAQQLFDMIKSGKVAPSTSNPEWTKYDYSIRQQAYSMWENYLNSQKPTTTSSSGSSAKPSTTTGTTSTTTTTKPTTTTTTALPTLSSTDQRKAEMLFGMIKSGSLTPSTSNPEWTKFDLNVRKVAYAMWESYLSKK